MYKMLVCDIDGTLLNKAGELTPRVKEALKAATQQGVRLTLATGRRLHNAIPVAQELNIDAPLILANGTVIVDPLHRETLFHQPLPPAVIEQVLPLVQEHGVWNRLYRHAFDGHETYYDSLPEASEAWLFASKDPERGKHGPYAYDSLDFEPVNIALLDREDKIKPLIERFNEIREKLPFELLVHHDFPGYLLVEFSHHECTKASGIGFLAEQWGIQPDEVIAVGDNVNDLEMIQFAGLGVAMGNAVEELKAIADVIAPSNEENGVAWIIEKYLLNQRQ
jgi:Cof subfamily protein (haloacid dehalogenase superfamily)